MAAHLAPLIPYTLALYGGPTISHGLYYTYTLCQYGRMCEGEAQAPGGNGLLVANKSFPIASSSHGGRTNQEAVGCPIKSTKGGNERAGQYPGGSSMDSWLTRFGSVRRGRLLGEKEAMFFYSPSVRALVPPSSATHCSTWAMCRHQTMGGARVPYRGQREKRWKEVGSFHQ